MDIITISLIVVVCVILGLGFVVISDSREKLNRLYSLNILSIICWGLAMIYYRLSTDHTIVLWTRLLYVSASLIASNFLYFTYVFPIYKTQTFKNKLAIFFPNIVLILLILFTDGIVKGAEVNSIGENIIYWGNLYIYYVLYILFYFNFAFYRLYKKINITNNQTEKLQILYLFWGYSSSGLIAFTTNLILPSFGYFTLNWVGQISTILMATAATYAIIKHQLFNTKVIATELLTFVLWITLLIRFLVSQNLIDYLSNGITLVLVFFVGLFLIKSVIREVNQREKIERLAADLKKANSRLVELDKQKSEFVSFATHQLRAPLTAMKGYTSLILEGEYGETSPTIKKAISTIFESAKTLTNIVNDYLNISRIELGSMKYTFEMIDLKDMVKEVIAELKPNIDKKELNLSFSTHPSSPTERFMIHADKDKFKQVVVNLIDNSVKYTPQGSLDIHLNKDSQNRKIIFSIKDTGVGIAPEVMPKLFSKFTRAENANKQNIYGTGLGLYVAKEIVEAHKGRVWAESDGEGKGSTFYIEMEMEL
jgi:signal transduction histidine kinase